MKKHALSVLLVVALSASGAQPVFGVSKEIIQMMQQLDTLQQMMQNMQKTLDTQTAVLRTLMEQANDNVNSVKASMADLRKTTEQNLASTSARFDSITGQIEALTESLEETKARLAKLSDQLAQTQNIIQTLHTPSPSGIATTDAGTPNPGGSASPRANIPDADTLYKSGLSYYNGGQYPLAIQAFEEYLKYYGDSDLASNSQFYVGDCYYNQGNYTQAIEEYNKVLERYPKGNKLPAAQLKKGYALLALAQTQAGARELRSLIRRYPNSHESELARQRLRKLPSSGHGRRGE